MLYKIRTGQQDKNKLKEIAEIILYLILGAICGLILAYASAHVPALLFF